MHSRDYQDSECGNVKWRVRLNKCEDRSSSFTAFWIRVSMPLRRNASSRCLQPLPPYCHKGRTGTTMNKRSNQKGVALFFALIVILILSVLCVSIMFLSQSETWSSLNYRMTTQGRYGAENGLNTAANFIVSSSYTAPTTGGADS